MNYDEIGRAYIDTVVEAVEIGDQIPDLEISQEARKNLYKKQVDGDFRPHKNINENLVLMVKHDPDESNYVAVDHSTKEAHYKASFIKRKTLNGLPFEHYVQDEVMKNKNSSLPKHFASEIALDHVEHTGIPLVSSEYQMYPGHKMWRNIVNSGLKRGYHAYRFKEGRVRKINTLDHDDTYDYYHDSEEGLRDHLVISKKELKR